MKCEKCERELIGDSVSCEDCGHDSYLRRASVTQPGNEPRYRAAQPFGTEANLIRFPKNANSASPESENDSETVPTWRNAVKERVRQFREQRPELGAAEREIVNSEDVVHNPIVEAALKRLHKTPGAFPEATGGSFSTTAVASVAEERYSNSVGAQIGLAATNPRRQTAGLTHSTTGHLSGRSVEGVPGGARAASFASLEKNGQKTDGSKAEARGAPSLQQLTPPVPAGMVDRTLAGLFDFMLVLIACVPLYSIHSITGLTFGQSAAYAVLGIAVWMAFIYQMWTMLVAGRTCGMAWRHLRVVDANTRDPRFPQWRLFVRALCGTVSLLLPPLNLAVIWASGNQSGLADLLSTTVLLQTHATRASTNQV